MNVFQARASGAAAPGCLQRLLGLGALVVLAAGVHGAVAEDLSELSLESLMDIEVTTVSKRPQKRSSAAAAIYVITGEDIRRSGVRSIPDALRRVPGLHVARTDANKWAVSSRGFGSRFANKLLVLIDGRTVYTPLFAGVYWESLDTPLQDIERIEVIRGPGGTLWGANAVNGVINIITKPAAQTQGGLLWAGAGNETPGFATVRHGAGLGQAAHYRVYAKYAAHGTGHSRATTHDDWDLGQGGFRLDWQPGSDSVTVQGDYYRGQAGQQVTLPIPPANVPASLVDNTHLWGANLMLRWRRDLGEDSDLSLLAYVDHVSRDGLVLFEDRDTLNLDFQHHFHGGRRQNIVWGVGYRRIRDDTRPNRWFRLIPASRTADLLSGFVQDEISLLQDKLALIVGSKFEHNDFTGFEYQPNLRLRWSPRQDTTLWGAISRAVRTPARGEHDVRLQIIAPVADPRTWTLVGSRAFESEELLAYELGSRWQGRRLSLDLALFYNDYDALRTFEPTRMSATSVELPFDNRMHGRTYGLELAVRWNVGPDWRLHGAYSWLDMSLELDPGSADSLSQGAERASPRHMLSLHSQHELTRTLELDLALRWVDEVQTPTGNPMAPFIEVDAYTAVDARLGWQVSDELELALAGLNLLDASHREFTPDFIQSQPTEAERSVYASLTWRF